LLLVVVVLSSGRGLVRIVYERRDNQGKEKDGRTWCPSAKVNPPKSFLRAALNGK
jgi:hypothetical protein